VIEGLRRRFLRNLVTGQMSMRTRRLVERLGLVGSVARGMVIVVVGALVIDAAVTFDPKKSGGLGKALLALKHQPYGPVLLAVAALGLIAFGVYGLCEARWRRVIAAR